MRPVTVVVPCHQTAATLAACLRAIVRNAGSHPDWNLLVVDDGSLDVKGVAAAVSECPGAQLLRIPRGGVARAMNAARAHPLAKGRDLLRVHADVVVDTPDFINRLAEAAADRVGVVGVRLVYPDGRVQSEGRSLLNGLGFHPQHRDRRAYQVAGAPGGVVEVDGVSGACAYYRADTLEAAGGFDENYGGAWLDDDDFCVAARRRDWRVVVNAGVRAVHFTPSYAPTFQRGVVDADADILNFASQARANALQLHADYWRKKWGWHPFYPDLGEVRRLYGDTALCWQIGEPLRNKSREEFPLVDCCLVTWNTLALLRRCLESLAKTEYPADRVRVFVADNASTDGTREALAELAKTFPFPLVVIPMPVNTGCPAGMNAAFAAGSAELVARLDDDIVLPPEWLRILVGTMQARPYAACVGPKILNDNATRSIQCGPFRHWPPVYGHEEEADQGQADYVARTTHVRGCCNLYQRDALRRVGLLDVRYSPSQFDDPDHHLALLHAGYEVIYDGRVGVVHKLNNGLGVTTAALSNQTANHHKMQGKWGPEAYRILERAIDLSREGRVLPDDGDTSAWLATGPSPEIYPLRPAVPRDTRMEFFRRYDELAKLRARPSVADWSDEYLALALSRSLQGKLRNALDLALSALGFAPLRVEAYAAAARYYSLLGQPGAADELRRVGRLLFPAATELSADESSATGMVKADMRARVASIGEAKLGADDLDEAGMPPVRLRVLMVNTFEARLPGGDMHQIKKTRQYLRALGVQADIACRPRPDPRGYDLIHVWNTVFPHQTLCQLKLIRSWRPDAPVVLSPIYWDCRERHWADQAVPAIFSGSAGLPQLNERLQSLASDQLLINGTLRKNAGEPVHPGYEEYQRECIELADHLLPQSEGEIANIRSVLGVERPYTIVRNGAETSVFTSATPDRFVARFGKRDFVLTVGLVEQRKNQLMLLHALRDTGLPIVVIGRHWDRAYYRLCRRFAPPGALFIDHLPHDELASAFAAARVHALPSWMECAAFAHVEAALAGCPLVAGNRTSEREYFGANAYYADPASVVSIRDAVLQAVRNRDADAPKRAALRKRFAEEFTWDAAARATLAGYEAALAARSSAPSLQVA